MFGTSPSPWPSIDRSRVLPAAPVVSTGFSDLDALIGGYRPGLIEVSGGVSSGKTSLAFRVCHVVMSRGGVAAWITTPSSGFFPVIALEESALPRLLVARVPDGLSALRAARILLDFPQAIQVAVIDVPGFAPKPVQLAKLQTPAERGGVPVLVLNRRSSQSPSLGAAITLRLGIRRLPRSHDQPAQILVEVLRDRQGSPARSCAVAGDIPLRVQARGFWPSHG